MIIAPLCRAAGVAVVALPSTPLPAEARAAREDGPALPIRRIATIQPIQACPNVRAPATAAPVTFLLSCLTDANAALNQAGVAVAAAPPRQSATPRAGCFNPVTTTGARATDAAFDSLRDQVRLPGQGRSSDRNTPDLLFVNTINGFNSAAATSPRTEASRTAAFGWRLRGGNGIVLATGGNRARVSPGVFQNRAAAADTLGHAIAHNLGLPDTAGQPRNLMQSAGPVMPTDVCQVAPCARAAPGKATDQLAAARLAALRAPPVFRELPNTRMAMEAVQVTFGSVHVPHGTSFASGGSSSLTGVEYRFPAAPPRRRRASSPEYAPGCPDAGRLHGSGRAADFVAENSTKLASAS